MNIILGHSNLAWEKVVKYWKESIAQLVVTVVVVVVGVCVCVCVCICTCTHVFVWCYPPRRKCTIWKHIYANNTLVTLWYISDIMIQGDIFFLRFPHFLYFVLVKQNLLKVNLRYLIYRILGTYMYFKHVSFFKARDMLNWGASSWKTIRTFWF